MSELGHDVLGVDFSPKMVEKATSKGGGTSTRFEVGDAQSPELPDAAFDVVVARHVLWTLSDPVVALGRWANLVKPAGRMILIEGRWFDSSGSAYPDEVADRLPWNGGVAAETLAREVARLFDQVHVLDLADSPQLWGRSVSDERYVVIASDPPLGGD